MNCTTPNTGIPNWILLGIIAMFAVLWVIAVWRDPTSRLRTVLHPLTRNLIPETTKEKYEN